MDLDSDLMVQIKQQTGTGVEPPHPRSFLCGNCNNQNMYRPSQINTLANLNHKSLNESALQLTPIIKTLSNWRPTESH